MKTRIYSFALLAGAVALVAAILFVTQAAVRLATAKRQLAKARETVIATRLKAPPTRAMPAPVAPLSAMAESSSSSSGVSAAFVARLEALKKTATGRAPGGVPLIHPEDLFEYHAPLKAAWFEAVKGHQWTEYGAFFANAKLSTAEIAQFEAIALDHERAMLEIRKTAEARGVPPSDSAIQQIKTDADQVRKSRLLALLGEERFRQFDTYEREDNARHNLLGLWNLVATTFYTDEPVTPAQINQLAALTTELGMFDPRKAEKIPDAFDQLAIKSATILSRRQLEVFDLMLDHAQYSLARWQMNNPEGTKGK